MSFTSNLPDVTGGTVLSLTTCHTEC